MQTDFITRGPHTDTIQSLLGILLEEVVLDGRPGLVFISVLVEDD
jgi:hypothetical protein